MRWKGPLSQALRDTTRYLDVEGAIRCGKTTMALWKVLTYLVEHPGLKAMICRWTDDATASLLKPLFRGVCDQAQVPITWVPEEHYYRLENGSIAYVHGLKPSEDGSRYGKLRGKTLAVIYVDQTEELPGDFWPELQGRLSQQGFPQQLIITPNAVAEDHWISDTFPTDNHAIGFRYIKVSVYDNAHNLGAYIQQLEAAYPLGHPKRRTMIDGLRGLNVIGKPVYAGYFERARHLAAIECNPHLPLLEALDFGKHHPCVVWGQSNVFGGFDLLGGILGRDLALADFAPIVTRYRNFWFPDRTAVETCCDPAGMHDPLGMWQSAKQLLYEHQIVPRAIETSNSPTVRRACIEALMDQMRRRVQGGEAFRCHPDRWLMVAENAIHPRAFVPDAFEAGYVWDEHSRSVGNKSVAVPLKDGWYEHGMNCVEYLQANFGMVRPSAHGIEQELERVQARALKRAQRDADPYDHRVKTPAYQRGGYA